VIHAPRITSYGLTNPKSGDFGYRWRYALILLEIFTYVCTCGSTR
jgi:hypothetical protein